MNNRLRKAMKECSREMTTQIDIIYPAAAIVWYQEYGWRELRILRRFVTSSDVWEECASHGTSKSMLQMLEEETGIEMQLSGYDKSYHDFVYLDGSKWSGNIPTVPQAIYMFQMEKKWLAPLLLSCLCITLHRDEGWGADRLGRFISHVDALRQEWGRDTDLYKTKLKEITGIPVEKIWEKVRTKDERSES